MENFTFPLGVTATDQVTKFTGVVMARAQYLTGCNQYALQNPNLDKDGAPRKWVWFDEHRIVVQDLNTKVDLGKKPGKPPGGPIGDSEFPPE